MGFSRKKKYKYKIGSKKDPFSPKFDHSKCYFWCGNPYCHSRPATDKEIEEFQEDD